MMFGSTRDLLKCYIILTWLSFVRTTVHGAPSKCCQGDAKWIAKSHNCTDGKLINLDCSGGFYAILQKEDHFLNFQTAEKDNGSWLTFPTNNTSDGIAEIPPDRYCLAISNENLEGVGLVCFTAFLSTFNWKLFVFGILSIISSFFFALTLLVYFILPEMRDLHDKAIMSATGAFTVAYLILGFQQLREVPLGNFACVVLANLMYYAYLCAFFWLNIISFNVWRTVWFKSPTIPNDIMYILFCCFGWGVPLLFLGASITVSHIQDFPVQPRFGEVACWFPGSIEAWVYFYGPMTVLLIINYFYFGLTCWKLWYEYRDVSGNKLKVFRTKCTMYLKLMLIMGVTWIFEVLSFATGSGQSSGLFWIVSDFLNLLQGVIIFLILVVTRKRVKKHLAKKKIFGFSFPKSWTAYVDEENCDPAVPEELELSQSS